ncbi:MAG: M28 family peptidase [Deltaproteobacteria bacterium]|nr:M28 family peptidase [Deltaproteobacteria bacterium]
MRRRTLAGFAGFAGLLAGLACVAGCAGARPRAAQVTTDFARAEQTITAEELAGVVRFLADDALEGRAPGTRGDRLARAYVASVFGLLGLEPGGPNGSFEQPFDLVGVTTKAPSRWTFRGRGGEATLRRHRAFVVSVGGGAKRVDLDDAEVVFVGYGIQAPEHDWDDFKGADLRGKVLLFLNDDPDWDPDLFAGKRRLYYGRWTYKFESAARQGAAGAIVIHTTESASYPWQTVQTSWEGENSRLPSSTTPRPALEGWVTEDAARRIAALGGRDLEALRASARERTFRPVPLGVRTSVRLDSEQRRYATANVLALLPGRDPERRDEVIVYTAHHDHLGTAKGPDGKTVVYNGALDNASGVAQLLAIARASTALPEPPERSMLFLAVGAEEQGLLGSEYWASRPTVPPGRLIANINFDGANIWGRTRDVALVGAGKSTLDAWVEKAAARQDRTVGDDPFPERGSFYRSDQLNFARIGVPALFFGRGIDFVGRPAGWGRTEMERWVAEHYHQPSDDFDPATWDFTGMVDDARLGFAIGLALAESDARPEWLPSDEFREVRARSLAASSDGAP